VNPAHPGLFFEELQVGWEAVSPPRTLTAADIDSFMALSGDRNPLHTDTEFAERSRYRGRIAHGLLGLIAASGLASALGFMEGTVEAFLSLEWQFRHPLLAGDTVQIRARVKEKKVMPGEASGLVIFAIDLRNQKGQSVQRGEWRLLIRVSEGENRLT
jgi:acyl dehydratase